MQKISGENMTGSSIKVAMYFPYYLPAKGGAESATYNLTRELRSNTSCDARIWAFAKENKLSKNGLSENSLNDDSMKDVPIIKYYPTRLPLLNNFSMRLLFDLGKSDEQLIHFQGAPRAFNRLLIEKMVKGKITFLTTHGLQESVSLVKCSKARFFLNPFFLESLRSINHIIALSRADANFLLSMGIQSDKISVIPNGLDESKFKNRRSFVNKNNKLKILTVARFDANKNYEVLVPLVAKLSKKFDLEAYFVGALSNQAYFNKILRLIKQYKVESLVKIGLSLDDSALADCYMSCDLFILPSRVETFGISILEAMYCGLPVIASNVGGIPDILMPNTNSLISNPDNIEELYCLAFKLLNDKEMRRTAGSRNKELSRNYTWRKVAIRTSNLYKSFVE
jgi:glycosyltransferase involved in cell wall biosynthesis